MSILLNFAVDDTFSRTTVDARLSQNCTEICECVQNSQYIKDKACKFIKLYNYFCQFTDIDCKSKAVQIFKMTEEF